MRCDKIPLRICRTKPVYVGLFLTMVKTVCGRSNFFPYTDIMDNLISAAILFFSFFTIFTDKYNRKNLFIYIAIGFVTLYSAIVTGMMLLPVTVLIILAIRREPIHKVAWFMYFWKIRFFIAHSVLAFALVPTGLSSIGGYYQANRRYRMNFGFCFAGQFADYVIDLMVLWTICNYEKINTKTYPRLILVAVLTYICSDSKTGFGVSCILIFMVWLTKNTMKCDGIIKKCAQLCIPFFTVFVFQTIVSFSRGKKWAYFIDSILTTRIRLNGYLLDLYGGTWFGQAIDSYSGEYSAIWQSTGSTSDCVYPWLVIEMGAIWLVLIAISFYILARRNDRLMNCLLLIWAFGALTDTDYLYGTCSFIMLLVSLVFTKDKCILEGKRYMTYNVESHGR